MVINSAVFLYYLIVHLTVQYTQSFVPNSHLNKFELDNVYYQIQIDSSLIELDSRFKKEENNNHIDSSLVRVRSVYGQMYECRMPGVTSILNQQPSIVGGEVSDNIDSLSNTLFSTLDSQTLAATSTFKLHNFTIINDKIKIQMRELEKFEPCVYKILGWWTYELCFGQYAYQYHTLANGSIEGDKINLGNYLGDLNWLSFNETGPNLPMSSGVLFHEQYYEMGNLCEINQKPRRTLVKIFCDEKTTGQIDLINELETCEYEIHVATNYVCSIPSFSNKPTNYEIICHPVLGPDDFTNYLSILEETKKQKQVDDLSLSYDDDEIIDSYEEYSELDIDWLKTQLREDSFMTEMIKVKEVGNKFEELINTVKKSIRNKDAQEIEHQLDDSREILANLFESFQKNDKLVNRISDLMNSVIENLDDSESLQDLNAGDLPTTNAELHQVNKAKDKSEKGLVIESKKILAKVDRVLEEKLSKNTEQSGSVKKIVDNKIKVKIFTIDKYGNIVEDDDKKSLSDIEPQGLKELISSMLENQQQKQQVKILQKSYNFVFNKETSEFLSQQHKNHNKNLVIFDDEIYLEAGEKESDLDDEKLIIH